MKNPPCPHLPEVHGLLGPTITRRYGQDKGAGFYLDALRYAQSLWLEGKPAQAILQLNKAWMAEVEPDDPIWVVAPPPYAALKWILKQARTGERGFIGNPVRHFQHLASRMSGPRRELRMSRAWACFHLASRVLEDGEFPPDGPQLAREGLWIPPLRRVLDDLARSGWRNEESVIRQVYCEANW